MISVGITTALLAFSQALDCVEQALLGATTNHSRRVAWLGMVLCRRLGLPEDDACDMAACAVLHDSALTEYALSAGAGGLRHLEDFQRHCRDGENNARRFPLRGDIRGVILHHHEDWNGGGLHGLRGEDIPLRAAVLRLADHLDVRFRLGAGDPSLAATVPAYVRAQRGVIYAPRVADAFLEICDADLFRAVSDTHIEASLEALLPPLETPLDMAQLLAVCDVFAGIVDHASRFTGRHSRDIARAAERLARLHGLDQERCRKIRAAALLHDLGKLSIPTAILEKPGPLTEEEFLVMRGHAFMTWEILSRIRGLEDVALWAACHHEKLDGSGYPFGRTAPELSFECRLLACADIYQALTEERPYRPARDHRHAMYVLEGMAAHGKVDPDIVARMGPALENADRDRDATGKNGMCP